MADGKDLVKSITSRKGGRRARADQLKDAVQQAFGSRLESALNRIGTRKNAATLAGVSDDMLLNYTKGVSKPPFEVVARICTLAGVSLEWMATGMEPMEKAAVFPSRPTEGMVLVPRFAVVASAGPGSVVEADVIDGLMSFREDWIRRVLGVDPKRLALISAEGDSMRPTISEGDVLLIDTSVQRVRDSAIYVLRMDGVLLVKRLRLRVDGTVDVISDNGAYAPETVPASEVYRLTVVGRVVWHGGLV